MVASSHGREGGQVVADLLARLDVVAWDVCPGHKHIYFIKYPAIPLLYDPQFHPGLQVTLSSTLVFRQVNRQQGLISLEEKSDPVISMLSSSNICNYCIFSRTQNRGLQKHQGKSRTTETIPNCKERLCCLYSHQPVEVLRVSLS